MRLKHALLCAVVFFMTVHMGFSQRKLKDVTRDESGNLKLFKLETPFAFTDLQKQSVSLLKEVLNTDASTDYKLVKTRNDKDGRQHLLYQQQYKGVPVYDGYYYLHFKQSQLEFANGEYTGKMNVNTTPTITENKATEIATAFAAAKYKLPVTGLVNSVKADLTIFRKEMSSRDFRLTYQLLLVLKEELKSQRCFVDAHTGEVLASYDVACSIHGPHKPPPGQTIYSGQRNFTGEAFGGQFRLRENRGGLNIITLDRQNQLGLNGQMAGVDFFDNDNNWTAAEHPNDLVAFDVHWGIELFTDYFRLVLGRAGWDNANRQINSLVHVTELNQANQVVPMDNAFYTPVSDQLAFGDGNFLFNSVSSLDIVGHEAGHGFARWEVNFNNGGESGPLNEGFSDIWGAVVENYGEPTKQHWQIGEEVQALGFTCLRSLRDPNNEGFRIDLFAEGQYPDTRLGNFWDANVGDIHINATVLGHWFFLVSEGGTDVNDVGNAYIVNGIGIDRAAQIAYLAECNLTPAADFAAVRVASVQAAIQLYGANSCERRAVENAWFAVNVGPASTINPTFNSNIIGPDPFCGTVNFTIDAVPPGSVVSNWISTNPSIANILSSSGLSVTVDGQGTGMASLWATVTPPVNSCYAQYSVTRPINVGPEFNGTENITLSSTEICIGSPFHAGFPSFNSATSYIWSASPNIQLLSNGVANIQAQATSGGAAWLAVTVSTPCGNETITRDFYVGSQFDARKIPFELVSINCQTGSVVVAGQTFNRPTTYYWTVTEYMQNGTFIGSTSVTTTTNILNFTAHPKTYYGTICLQIDISGCGISLPRCYDYSRPCPRRASIDVVDNTPPDAAKPQIGIVAFPNPASSYVTVRLPEMPDGRVTFEVLNENGQVLKNIAFANSQAIQIPVQSLAKGLYVVRVRYSDKLYTTKFLKE
jgi:bacillolysin